MCRVEFVIIAIRILALGMGVRAFVLLGDFLASYLAGRFPLFEYLSFFGTTLLEAAVWGVAAIYCRQRSERLAWEMFVDDEEASSSVDFNLTAEDLLTLSCLIAGVFIVVPAVSSFVEEAVWFVAQGEGLDQYWSEVGSRAQFTSICLQLALGAVLLFGAQKIARRLLPTTNELDKGIDGTPPASASAEEPSS